jgi:tetraacyldisaccharide 4'-kinase
MTWLRKLLFPIAVLYGLITSIRNYLYDKGILKSHVFDVPIIAVGNLSVGGTGKTPQIESLIRLLSPHYKIATLSRGYKRKSEGFILADVNSNAEQLGDEPYQYFKKFPQIQVAVDADRRNGITQLLGQKDKPEVILLDDAYQHRKVKAGFYILLTAYGDLFCDDWMLPTGNLRESRSGAERADMIIITKCPNAIPEIEQEKIKQKIGLDKPIFFSFVDYDDQVYSATDSLLISEIKNKTKILLAGIAKPKPFFDFLKVDNDVVITYPDHHHFSNAEIVALKSQAGEKIIVTTEKDFVRLEAEVLRKQLYYLPIKSRMISNATAFDQIILDYVGIGTGNR